MSIQSTINQGLSVAALLVGQNPAIRAASEKRVKRQELAQREETLLAQYDVASGEKSGIPHVALGQRILDDLTQVAEERWDIDPTRENYETILNTNMGLIPGHEAASERYLSGMEVERDREEFMSNMKERREAATAAAAARQAEISRSRDIARLITEDIPNIDFDWRTYEPPVRKEND